MSQLYHLKFPFTNATGTRIDRLEIRRLTRADLKAAYKYSKDEVEQEDFLLARLTKLQVEDIGDLDIADSKALTDFFRGMVEGTGDAAQA